jgi:renalase
MHIAVIGAGLAGVTCARRLQSQGHSVFVYEKGSAAGGRMSTRETELGGFDHGAQYFTADSERFKGQIAHWRREGRIDSWKSKLVTLDNGTASMAGLSKQRFVGVPGMGSLVQQLAQELQLRTEQLVTHIERHADHWLLTVRADTVPVEATAGPFDAVLVALPADEAVPLLQPVPEFARQAERARFAPCWALLLGFQDALGLGYHGAWVRGSRLAWIAHDASKPQRRPGEHWVAHASAEWSAEHLEDDPERVKEKLLKAFHGATGSQVQPIYAEVHRWRHAQAGNPLPAHCLWDAEARIGACGDWFAAGLEGGARVENAYLSGLALAEAVH